MTDVFISYAHEDHAYVRNMAPALEAEGFTVWWDHTIPPGKTWDEVIAKGIADARCCIVLWSQSSVVSDWVKEEATIAKDHRKFIPVQIDNSEPPVGFRRIQAAHLQNWTGNVNEPQWQMLVREIRGVVSASREGGGGASARTPTQPYAPRAYQAPPTPRSDGKPPLAMFAAIAAAAVLAIVVGVSVLGGDEPTLETPAPAPAIENAGVTAPPPAPSVNREQQRELERLRRERDEAQMRAEAERRARTDAERIALERQAEAERLARQREQEARRASVAGTTWGLRRRFIVPEREWQGGDPVTFNAGGEFTDRGGGRGYWRQSGTTVTFGYYGGLETTYTGTISGNQLRGRFTNNDGHSGEFTMTLQ